MIQRVDHGQEGHLNGLEDALYQQITEECENVPVAVLIDIKFPLEYIWTNSKFITKKN